MLKAYLSIAHMVSNSMIQYRYMLRLGVVDWVAGYLDSPLVIFIDSRRLVAIDLSFTNCIKESV